MLIFILALVSTLFCTAVNCYTWRVAYPLWRTVPPAHFAALHREYLRLLGPVITLPHIAMFFATLALLARHPARMPGWQALAVFLLAAAVILLSAIWAGSIHARIAVQPPTPRDLTTLIHISAIRSLLMLAASTILCLHLASTPI